MKTKGFTLIETLIAVSIMAVIGIVIMELLRITFQGNSKSQLINSIKQNGQSAVSSIEDSLRFADRVICSNTVANQYSTIVVVKDDKYTRIKIYWENGTVNGYIARDFPTPPFSSEAQLCIDDLAANKEYLTNKDKGISILSGNFSADSLSGEASIVSVRFDAKASKDAPSTFESQVGAVPFQTSVQLR